MSSRHDPVMRMFRCLFIVLKISLFSMSSRHDSVMNDLEFELPCPVLVFFFVCFSFSQLRHSLLARPAASEKMSKNITIKEYYCQVAQTQITTVYCGVLPTLDHHV